MLEEAMMEKKVWAVVGANNSHHKFGNKIYRTLKNNGYTVYPVNPNYDMVEGDKCYKDLSSLPEKPEVLNMVVSPKHGMSTIEEASRLGIKNIWLQPGTYDNEMMALIKTEGLTAVQACILVCLG